jgi:hypothetical protein
VAGVLAPDMLLELAPYGCHIVRVYREFGRAGRIPGVGRRDDYQLWFWHDKTYDTPRPSCVLSYPFRITPRLCMKNDPGFVDASRAAPMRLIPAPLYTSEAFRDRFQIGSALESFCVFLEAARALEGYVSGA